MESNKIYYVTFLRKGSTRDDKDKTKQQKSIDLLPWRGAVVPSLCELIFVLKHDLYVIHSVRYNTSLRSSMQELYKAHMIDKG
jgi:hypothetical protein